MDQKAINTVRILAAEVVQKANSGHPGAPMGCAPMAHVLFTKFMNMDPQDPGWINRDRFVLSNGHACALQYVMLHLLGYDVTMDDLKSFRQTEDGKSSKTPGHPEVHCTPGVEVCTGPLGQGISNSVGMAIAQAHLAARFNKPKFNLIDNYVYCIVGDGCLQEGVASEACSLAGHLRLGKLIVLYDDNKITIDGETCLSFTEDVCKRFEAYGWFTQSVSDGNESLEDIQNAINKAKNQDKPSLIKIRTTIGYGSSKAGSHSVHGAPLGAVDLEQVKQKFQFDPKQSFVVPNEVGEFYKNIGAKGTEKHKLWNSLFLLYQSEYPDLAKEFDRRLNGKLPENWFDSLPNYSVTDAAVGTRKISEEVISHLQSVIPELVGGSADLTPSNLTRWKGAVDFQHPSTNLGSYEGRYIRFGVREHGMAAICNGIAAYGMLIPYCSTFLNFISYGIGAVRLSALSKFRVIYVMTHDSIGLGEDGPTHQPIETLACLRATPNLLVFRPADGNEVVGSYFAALNEKCKPSVICLSRQNAKHLENSSIPKVMQGAYQIYPESAKNAQLCIAATGTEVQLAIEAAKILESEFPVSVVSMPCWELFLEKSYDYRASVFVPSVPVLSVEALSTFGWDQFAHAHIGMTTFGASGTYDQLYRKFNITVAAIVQKAKDLREFCKYNPPANKMCQK